MYFFLRYFFVFLLTISEGLAQVHPVAPYASRDSVTPNCTNDELYEYSALLSAANNSDTTFESFLRGLPPRALNTFTLVYESQSLARDDVTPLLPRVIRFSTDGRLVIAYACNPTSSHYGEVEVMKFDDESRKFKTALLKFKTGSNQPMIAPERRVVENPTECLRCHSNGPNDRDPNDLRPIWENYHLWPGVYGSNKDSLDETPSERENFQLFRQQQANNPCYATLPWSFGGTSGQHPDFPYRSPTDYALGVRPNTKLILAWNKLNYLRLVRRTKNQLEAALGSQRTQDLLMLFLARNIRGCTDQSSWPQATERCSIPGGHCLFTRELQETITRIIGPTPSPLILAIANRRSPLFNEMSLQRDRVAIPDFLLSDLNQLNIDPHLQPTGVSDGSSTGREGYSRALIDELVEQNPDILQAALRATPQTFSQFSTASTYGESFSCIDYRVSTDFMRGVRQGSLEDIATTDNYLAFARSGESYQLLAPRNYELCELIYTKIKAIERRYRVSTSNRRSSRAHERGVGNHR